MQPHILIFGYSYTTRHLLPKLPRGWRFTVSSRTWHNGLLPGQPLPQDVTHILVTTPPDPQGTLAKYAEEIKSLPYLQWLGYLSATSVYGDHQGSWVDEDAKVINSIRYQEECAWQQVCKNTMIFRLAAIYGPGRSAIDRIKSGNGQIITKKGQFFSRIHVADLVQAISNAMQQNCFGVYNIADDMPTPPEEPMLYAYQLLSLEAPPPVDYLQANLSEMAMGFYQQNKKVNNKKLKQDLLPQLTFPSYQEGLNNIVQTQY